MDLLHMSNAFKRLYFLPFFLFCLMQITFFSVLFNPQLVSAAQVTFQWDENTEPDLDGYILYGGTSSGIYSFSVDVGNQTTYTLTGLEEGQTYYFALTAYDTEGDRKSVV